MEERNKYVEETRVVQKWGKTKNPFLEEGSTPVCRH